MKVSMARIRLYLKVGKKLSDGTSPIMLMCSFNGRKELSTGYSCLTKYWDKKGECVKKGYPNYVMINYAINGMKNDAIARRNEFERLGEVYTPSMILTPKKELSAHRNDVKGIIENYVSEKGLKENTIYNYNYTYHLLSEFDNEKIIVNVLKVDYVKRFIKFLSVNKKLNDGVIRMILSKVGAITNYAIQKGLMNADDYPFKDFKFGQKFKPSSKLDYIHWRTIDVMKSMLEDEVIDINGKRWKYKDGVLDELMDRNSVLFAKYFFMVSILWQGLAPVDICHILKKDVIVKKIGDADYYCWDGKRSKTSKSVKVRIKSHIRYNDMMVKTMLMFNDSDWMLPVLNGMSMDTSENTRKHRIGYTLYLLSPHLKDWFREVNDEVVKRNMENNGDIPLINMKCTYYSSRHSYAMAYMMKGGNPIALATLLGRSANTLAQYIKELEEEGDLVEAVSVMV